MTAVNVRKKKVGKDKVFRNGCRYSNFICFYLTVIDGDSDGTQRARIGIEHEHNSTEV